jgi:hypothetical protein
MRTRLLLSLTTLGLSAGCATPDGLRPIVAQNGACVQPIPQVSLATMPCAQPTWPPQGTVFTHPNGDGPEVELWGPPGSSGGGAGG